MSGLASPRRTMSSFFSSWIWPLLLSQRFAHQPPDLRSAVGVHRCIVGWCATVELEQAATEASGLQLVDDTCADAVSVDDDGVRLELLLELQDALGHLDGIESAVLAQDFDFPTLAHDNRGLVVPKRATSQAMIRGMCLSFSLIAPAGSHHIVGEELSARGAGKFAFDADAEEVPVLAIVLGQLFELGFVGVFDVVRVDLERSASSA